MPKYWVQVSFLVQADDLDEARDFMHEVVDSVCDDYIGIADTNIWDVEEDEDMEDEEDA